MSANDSLIDLLRQNFRAQFGPAAPAACLAALCTMSGRTGAPVHCRLVGGGFSHEAIAIEVEALIGKKYCRWLTSLTEPGLMSLNSKKFAELGALLYCGAGSNNAVDAALTHVLEGHPLRALDGSPTGHDRYRELNKPLALILVRGGEQIADARVTSKMLTLRIGPADINLPLEINRRCIVRSIDDAARTAKANELCERIGEIGWNRPVQFPANLIRQDRVKAAAADLDRMESLIRLVRVAILLRSDSRESNLLKAQSDDVNQILELLADARVADETWHIGPAELRLLESLQKVFAQTPFSLYCVQNSIAPHLSVDMIGLRIKALHNSGAVEPSGKQGHKLMWTLTPRGRSHLAQQLSARLRDMLDLLPSTPSSAERPTFEPHSAMDGEPSRVNRNSEWVSPPTSQGDL